MDAATRYRLACVGFHSPDYLNVRRVLEAWFRTYGLPKTIRSDNRGAVCGVGGARGHAALRLVGQTRHPPRTYRPGKPQQNSRHECMHLQ
jgi:hypothetical protein